MSEEEEHDSGIVEQLEQEKLELEAFLYKYNLLEKFEEWQETEQAHHDVEAYEKHVESEAEDLGVDEKENGIF